RVVVVDDEPLARRTLRILLDPVEGVEVVAEAGNGADAVRVIGEMKPDLVFLDVQMPEMDGFEVLRALGFGQTPAVVFVTAFDEHAVRAFDVHAADYLLKPFDDERFHRALERARARIGDRRVRELASRLAQMLGTGAPSASPATAPPLPSPEPPAPLPAPSAGPGSSPEYAERIVLKNNGRITFLDVGAVDWIEAADYVVRLHAGGATHVLREPISDLERRLDPRRFFRIHRSTIVNLASVKEMQPLFHGEYVVIMKDGAKLTLSRSRREKLRALLGAAF
ncbi:MAG TPA: LytTR family DNA-binding domain-containing protein, partial [Longimicrobium sp.]|nr:LytTR family DNA-binding domain-containing protein [Longimicrobium sp.]